MSHQKKPHTLGGLRLRSLRESYGKTQLDLELDANLGIGYLQRLELGKVQQPERYTLERILAALSAKFKERQQILELFGYAAPITNPNEAEINWAINVFQSEVNQATIPMYLLDCAHRLLAWNSLAPRILREVSTTSNFVVMPKLVFKPMSEMTGSILNAETFLSAQVRIMQYERIRCGDEAWYNAFLNEMREYNAFDEHWVKLNRAGQSQTPIRPLVPLKLDTGEGIAQFLVISEPFVQDHRFRVIYYIPTDAATTLQCLAWQEIA
jgi:transcriptional regulator with XRE-family HTH domain